MYQVHHITRSTEDRAGVQVIGPFQGEYRWLSNFWPVVVCHRGYEFPSVENAYQAAKARPDVLDRVVQDFQRCTPGQAKRLGRKVVMREDWNAVKIPTMRALVRQKFQDSDLARRLIATDPSPLVELNTWNDTFWGARLSDGVGENHLGRILEEVRRALMAK